ncbi:LexA family protein [Streptomyces chartreusis]|uniref:LexA family protein n=1 Tax=Streptomyces chartreusis TaxID=1969 RepID=UPI00367E0998
MRTLGAQVTVHSFWETEDGKSPSARQDLRRRVRDMEGAEERLTDRQRRIHTWIRYSAAEHGEAPSLRHIGQAVGLSSTAPVAYQLNKAPGGRTH